MSAGTAQNHRSVLPTSRIPYPRRPWARVKYHFWQGVYPIHSHVRDTLLTLGVVRHMDRPQDALGRLNPRKDFGKFLEYLTLHNFGNHFISWKEEGEVVGLRRLDGFERQYHFRIFENGEVRGHYEFTPECYPIKHVKEMGVECRREEILAFLGDWIMPY